MSKEAKILIGIGALVIIGGVVLSIVGNPKPKDAGAPVDQKSLVREHSPMTGNNKAKVQIVEFADFQCPACAQASPNLKKLMEEYKDNKDVNFVYRYFPLEQIHRNARVSAEAAAAAGEQGKFWEYNELLFAKQNEWATSTSPLDNFIAYASALGLDTNKFKQSVEQQKYKDIINTDLKDGESVGVNSTPSIYINGVKSDSYQYTALKQAIDDSLAGKPLAPVTEQPAASQTTQSQQTSNQSSAPSRPAGQIQATTSTGSSTGAK